MFSLTLPFFRDLLLGAPVKFQNNLWCAVLEVTMWLKLRDCRSVFVEIVPQCNRQTDGQTINTTPTITLSRADVRKASEILMILDTSVAVNT